MTRPLSPRDVADLLHRSPETRDAILIGGQALNIWALRYRVVATEGAFSRDIDFFGNRKHALAAERDWKGKAKLADFDDFTVNAAVVIVQIDDETHGIDFLTSVAGVDTDELRRLAIPVSASGLSFKVMHPQHVMQSQLENVYGSLHRRDDPDGDYYVQRCVIAVKVTRAAIKELLEVDRMRDALAFAERMSKLATSRPGIDAWIRDGLDLMDTIPVHKKWPVKFTTKRLPQLQQVVAAKREKRLALQRVREDTDRSL